MEVFVKVSIVPGKININEIININIINIEMINNDLKVISTIF
jgi:hypothetical protein